MSSAVKSCPFQRCALGEPPCPWCIWSHMRSKDDDAPIRTALERMLEMQR